MKFTGTFLIADDSPDKHGDCFLADGVDCPEDLQVVDEYNTVFCNVKGLAKTRREGNSFVAEIEFFDGAYEKFAKHLYTSVCGHIIERNEAREITKCSIKAIAVHITPNADSRIGTLVVKDD